MNLHLNNLDKLLAIIVKLLSRYYMGVLPFLTTFSYFIWGELFAPFCIVTCFMFICRLCKADWAKHKLKKKNELLIIAREKISPRIELLPYYEDGRPTSIPPDYINWQKNVLKYLSLNYRKDFNDAPKKRSSSLSISGNPFLGYYQDRFDEQISILKKDIHEGTKKTN